MTSPLTTRRPSGATGPAVSPLGNLRGPLESAMPLGPLDRVRGTRTGDLDVTVSARLTTAEADALKALAQRNGCSKASIIREMVRDALGQISDLEA
jgi:hypothetical protein